MIAAPNTRGSAHLDLARAIAALVVYGNHARNLFIVDFNDSASKGLATQVFYFVTSLGHESVMVFFVLSGFFITSSAVRQIGQWSWTAYLIDRLSRLHLVLVPALLATAVWDSAGMWRGVNTEIYQGTADNVLIRSPVAARSDVYHFAVSFFYLQTIIAAPFGSNGPLWSLANEFWYYVLFPALLFVVRGRSLVVKCSHGVLVGMVCWLVGINILLLFLIWLFGAALRAIGPIRFLPSWAIRAAGWLAGTGVGVILLAVAKQLIPKGLFAEYLLGGTFALWVYLTVHDARPTDTSLGWRLYHQFTGWMAGFSYTLYLVHVPFLIFLRSHLVTDARWQLTATTFASLVIISAIVLAYAWGFSLFTEKQTPHVRKWCRRQIGLDRLPPTTR